MPIRVAVVGSGPSAMAAVHSLANRMNTTESIYSFDVITAKEQANYNGKILKGPLKSRFDNTAMYKNETEDIDWTGVSESFGGFSTVWGAGMRIWDTKEFAKYGYTKQDIFDAAKELLRVIPLLGDEQSFNAPLNLAYENNTQFECDEEIFKNSFFQIMDPTFAISSDGLSKCRKCGQCLTGCPYGSIWSTEKYFNQLNNSEGSSLITGTVESIVENSHVINLNFDDGRSLTYDKVILACGPIASSLILLKSRILANITLADSQVFYLAILSRKKTQNLEFALSRKWLRTPDGEVMLSVYESNYQTLQKLKSRLGVFRYAVPTRFLNNHLLFGIGSLNSSKSGQIFLTDEDDISIKRVSNPASKKRIRKFRRNLNRSLHKFSNWILPFIEVPPPGYGFHIGGSQILHEEFGINKFNLGDSKKIFLADASNLPYLDSGPHTFNTMLITYLGIQKGLDR